jgi:hypothetical protein
MKKLWLRIQLNIPDVFLLLAECDVTSDELGIGYLQRSTFGGNRTPEQL